MPAKESLQHALDALGIASLNEEQHRAAEGRWEASASEAQQLELIEGPPAQEKRTLR